MQFSSFDSSLVPLLEGPKAIANNHDETRTKNRWGDAKIGHYSLPLTADIEYQSAPKVHKQPFPKNHELNNGQNVYDYHRISPSNVSLLSLNMMIQMALMVFGFVSALIAWIVSRKQVSNSYLFEQCAKSSSKLVLCSSFLCT